MNQSTAQAELQNYLNRNMAITAFAGQAPGGSAFVVNLFPVFEDDRAKFGKELPYIVEQQFPYGGITLIRIPAALRGKKVWRKIYPPKLLQGMDCPSQLDDPERIERAGLWWNIDEVTDLPTADQYGYSVLEVSAAFQHAMEPRSGLTVPYPITPQVFAAEGLVRPNLNVQTPQGQIGLGWCGSAEEIPALVERLKQQQVVAFNSLVAEAFTLEKTNKADRINNLHRIAFDWLGLDQSQCSWRFPSSSMRSEKKSCLLCGKTLELEALLCSNCGLLPLQYLKAMDEGMVLDIPPVDPIAKQIRLIQKKRETPAVKKS